MNTHPAYTYAAVTASDTVNIPGGPARSLYVGTGGDVAAVPVGATTAVVFKNVGAGTTLPIFAVRVNATATTATDVVALI